MAESSTVLQKPLPLQDRIAIVTGASRGIGRAIALHLSSLGAKLVINYTSTSSSTIANLLTTQLNSATPNHPRAVAIQADISDPTQVKSLFDAAEAAFNSAPHILINSAGVLDPTYPSIPTTSLEEFDRTFAVNTRGAFLCCREAANRLKKGGGGRIICLTTSLVAALKPGYGAYTASKAAVEAMVKILAKELKGTGITANCVAPGPIATEMFFDGKTEGMIKRAVDECPLGRLGQTEDVAPMVGFLASDAGEWINGQKQSEYPMTLFTARGGRLFNGDSISASAGGSLRSIDVSPILMPIPPNIHKHKLLSFNSPCNSRVCISRSSSSSSGNHEYKQLKNKEEILNAGGEAISEDLLEDYED